MSIKPRKFGLSHKGDPAERVTRTDAHDITLGILTDVFQKLDHPAALIALNKYIVERGGKAPFPVPKAISDEFVHMPKTLSDTDFRRMIPGFAEIISVENDDDDEQDPDRCLDPLEAIEFLKEAYSRFYVELQKRRTALAKAKVAGQKEIARGRARRPEF